MYMKPYDNFYTILLTHRTETKTNFWKITSKTRENLSHHSKFEYYKVCAEWCRKEEEKGGGSLQPGYNTCEQVQEKRHSFTRKWGWEPILPEGSEKTE